jgi:hypothetical protein
MVRNVTGAEKLTYVGHSQGNTQMFYALTQMEEEFLDSRVNLFVAMAPIVRLKNCENRGIKKMATYRNTIVNTLKWNNIYELFGKNWNSFSKKLSEEFPWFNHKE